MRPEVWISEGSIRRVRVNAEARTQALELGDLGTDIDALDWSRLPAVESAPV
jgi:hypothetical protein